MTRPIVNLDDLDFQPWGHGVQIPGAGEASERYGARIAFIGGRIGAKKLGYNLTVLPPGKRAFPFHSHHANEEMFFVLEGAGEIRIGSERYAIKQGDVIACPPGGKQTAHQIVNTSDADLRFLAVSTKESPEVAEYPDTDRFGVLLDLGTTTPEGRPETFRFVGRASDSLPYWEGE